MTVTSTQTPPEHTIAALCKRSHAISLEKGWVTAEGDPRSFATITNLNHSELSEAMEDWRAHKGLDEVWYEVGGVKITAIERHISTEPPASDTSAFKPCGILVELADFAIRVCQHCGTAGKGRELDSAFTEVLPQIEVHPDLDTLLAEVHLSVSLAYNSEKYLPDSDAYLEHIAEALAEVFAFCDANKIDLWAAIDEKEAYNRTRPWKHGNKKA